MDYLQQPRATPARVESFRMNGGRALFRLEPLERRALMDGEPWGSIPHLVGLDSTAEDFSNFTGAGQTIAVLDTGIDYTRPGLGGGFGPGNKVIGGYDFVDDDSDPLDTFGHGTRVASVLAAEEFAYLGKRFRGVAPDASLVALRIDEDRQPVPDERIEAALQWVIDHRETFDITVVNISFGFGSFAADEVSPVFGDELAALKSAGVFVVAASGNDGVTSTLGIDYPAADPNVFAVGAVDSFGTITDFSERNGLVDMVAPGDSVPAIDGGVDFGPDDEIVSVSGTSFAAPFVAGTAALMLQADASLGIADIRSILRSSSKNNFDGDDEFGVTTGEFYPMLQIDNAVALTLARAPGLVGSGGGDAPAANNNALSYDPEGVLHLAYYDSVDGTLKYATRNAAGDGWSVTSVIDDSDRFLGQYVAMAHDRFGRPAVAYFDGTAGDLKFAEFNGSGWSIETLDFKGSTGLYPSIVFDNDDRPVISYYNKGEGNLRLARRSGGNWLFYLVDSADDVGRSTSMAVDRNGRLGIAYENTSTGRLRYAQEQVDGSFRTVDADSTTRGVAWTSLAYDSADRPTISYYDAHPANLKYARRANGEDWQTETLVSKGATGLYGNLTYDHSGTANILYYNRRNNLLTWASGSFGKWDFSVLQSGGGRYISVAMDDDGELAYTWSESDSKVLHVETI